MRTPETSRRASGRVAAALLVALPLLVALLAQAAPSWAAPPQPYTEGTFEKGELRYRNGIPVLTVAGTPEEMGRQQAALIGDAAKSISDFPRRLLRYIDHEQKWPKLLEMAEALSPQFPDHMARELRAFGEQIGVARDEGMVGNTMADTIRGGFGCSSILVEPSRSATGGALFGRNLDYYSLGVLDRFSLVVVHRPVDRHAFVTIGFPGMIGCLSGMNDAGLAVAVHEVFVAQDGASLFNPKGVPYAMAFREVLEQCTTVEEAEELLRNTPRTTMLNLAVCDRQHARVIEMTPRTVASRGADEGLCFCTNHFRTPELAVLPYCPRYNKLIEAQKWPKVSVEQVSERLHAVHQGKMTIQTMIFEPATLRLHLGIGKAPSSEPPLVELDLAPLLRASRAANRTAAAAAIGPTS